MASMENILFCGLFVVMIYMKTALSSAESFSYVVVPMDLSHWSSSPQYLHLYMAGSHDTDLQITIPNTNFKREVSLRQDNRWAWREEFMLTSSLLTDALAKGFRIQANQPVNIHVTSHGSSIYSLTSHYTFPSTPNSTRFLLSPYLQRSTSSGYEPVYVVAAGEEPTQVTLSKYDRDTGLSSAIQNLSLEPYEVIYKTITNTATDYLIGMELNSTNPICVFVGNKRSYVPYEYPLYISTYMQAPQVSVYDTEYVVGPLLDDFERNGYSVMVFFDSSETECTINYNPDHPLSLAVRRSSHSCSCGITTGKCSIACLKPITRGGYVEIFINNAKEPVLVLCSRPCLALIIKHSQTISAYQRTTGYISPIAPPGQSTIPWTFNVPETGESTTVQDSYINVVLPTLNLEGLIIDGNGYSQQYLSDNFEIHDVGPWSVLTVPVTPGVHSVHHADSTVPKAVHVHGLVLRSTASTSYSSSFGFPTLYKAYNLEMHSSEPPQTTEIHTMTNLPESITVTETDGKQPKTDVQNDIFDYDLIILGVLGAVAAGVLVLTILVIHIQVRLRKQDHERQNSKRRSNNQEQQFSNIAYRPQPGGSKENQYVNKQTPSTGPRESTMQEVYENVDTLEEYTQLEGSRY